MTYGLGEAVLSLYAGSERRQDGGGCVEGVPGLFLCCALLSYYSVRKAVVWRGVVLDVRRDWRSSALTVCPHRSWARHSSSWTPMVCDLTSAAYYRWSRFVLVCQAVSQ